VDRKSLVSFLSSNRDDTDKVSRGSVEPSNRQNEIISLWSKSLNISQETIHDDSNFFSIGGDSLGALSLVKNINDYFSVNIRLSEIIAEPATPKSMREIIQSLEDKKR
jgi:acyl carrier protein